MKVCFFAMPWFTKAMWEIEDRRTIKQRTEIIGDYNGAIRQISNNETKQINLRIDTSKLVFINDGPFDLSKEYNLNLNYPNNGGISTELGFVYDVKILKQNSDSLVMIFEEMYDKKYKLNLKTER